MKPGIKTTELWLTMLAIGAVLAILGTVGTDLPSIAAATGNSSLVALVPVAKMLLGLAVPALAAYYAKCRKDLKLDDSAPAALKAAGFASVRALALVAALTGVALLAPSCAALKPFPGQAAECGKPLIGASSQLLQDLTVALASGNWSALLDQALIDSGPVVFCLVGALVTDLEHQTAAGGLGSGQNSIEAPSPVVQLGRARMWLAVRGR